MKEVDYRLYGARPGTSEATGMRHIRSVLLSDLHRLRPDAVVAEQYIMGEKEAINISGVVHVVGVRTVLMAYGVILGTVAEYGVEPFLYTPSQVKATATLYGAAGKGEVATWVSLALGVASVGEHVDDARAVGITHAAKRPGVVSSRVAYEELAL